LSSVDLDRVVTEQRHRVLGLVIWITFGAAATMAIGNVWSGASIREALALSGLSVLCLVALWLKVRRHLIAASILTFVSSLATVHFVVAVGEGIYDTGMLAYPMLIILSGWVFGPRLLTPAAAAVGLSVGWVTWSDWDVILADPNHSRGSDIVAVFALNIAAFLIAKVALETNLRGIRLLKNSETRVWLAYERTLEGWARALEYRDRETEGHTHRVTDLTIRMAEALGYSGDDLRRLRWGALLHDIGKLAIPDAILLKPGPLTEDERAVMNRHPEFARDMLQRIPFLTDCVDIPVHHHERWDGGGHPDQLAGEDIPLEARLFAVVDQWEALTSDRPYRPAWRRDTVRAHLERESGRSLDPAMVEVFLTRVLPSIPAADPDGDDTEPIPVQDTAPAVIGAGVRAPAVDAPAEVSPVK
jgi:putative nucleotidyltransferase with HDIG domain